MVAAGAKRLLAADERNVRGRVGEGGRARVHQVSKELPAGGHLEEGDAELLGHKVRRHRGGHRARARLEPTLVPRDVLGVGDDDRERVRWRTKELGAHDHVAVRISIGGGAEGGRWLGRLDG